MPTPIKLNMEITSIRYDLEGRIDNVISFLQKARTKYLKEGWTELSIDIDTESDGYGSDYSYASAKLMGVRLETDAEAEARETRDAQYKAHAEAQQRRQFEELKKKFGDS